MNVNVKLREYLDTHSISAYRVVQETHGKIAERTVYALARQGVKRVDLETLGEVIGALRRLTGQPVTPNDLLEVIEEPIEPDPVDAWLTASTTDLKAMLEDTERDENPQDVAKWSDAFTQAAQ
jgi:predicted NodU family carbamoyl transferase